MKFSDFITLRVFFKKSTTRNSLHASTEETGQEKEDGLLADVDNVVQGSCWSELHDDLLDQIACRLGIIELLGFRSACKAWRSASSNASAEIESNGETGSYRTPWFLQYNDSCHCTLNDTVKGRNYTMNIPELEDATCLASKGGWLLVYRDGLVFFFCPLSRARIDLPPLPHPERFDHVAAISSSPTSPDCIVCVINRISRNILVLNLIRRGAAQWTEHEYHYNISSGTIACVTHYDGVFYIILDYNDALVTFSMEDKKWALYKLVRHSARMEGNIRFPFKKVVGDLTTRKREELRLAEHDSISICGTEFKGKSYNICIFNENVRTFNSKTATHHLKGVWIQPRFHHLPPSYSWCP